MTDLLYSAHIFITHVLDLVAGWAQLAEEIPAGAQQNPGGNLRAKPHPQARLKCTQFAAYKRIFQAV